MTTQPEALRLAEDMERPMYPHYNPQAASELRRLHAENERLTLDSNHTCHAECQRPVCRLTRQRNALLEALQLALSSHGVMLMSDPPQEAWKVNRVEERARAAIKAVEENK
jgi:hypothetical protein